jgi:UDP-N-acetylglucosamine 3-dehydrogenase
VHIVAISGAGSMGRTHANCYKQCDEARVKYVIDSNAERAHDVAALCDAIPQVHPDTALKDPEVDIVDVCLPTYLHREYVEKAAYAGKHVFCEKPIALDYHDATAIIETCKSNNVKLGIGHVLRYFPEYEMAYDMITSGRLGKIGVVRMSRTGPFPGGWNNWYLDSNRSGSLLLDLSIHDFDFLAWCFGKVERVYARSVHHNHNRPFEYALAVLRMKSGVIAHIEGSWAHPAQFSYKFEVCGSLGMIEFDSRKTQPLTVLADSMETGKPGVAVPESPLKDKHPYLRQLREFLAFVDSKIEPRVTPEDAVKALQISLAAVKSAKTGEVVPV